MQLLQQMAIMFMMMLVGWIAARRGILDDKISSGIPVLL